MRLILCLLLAGCAGAPVGYGGKYEVVSANDASITIAYDNLVGGYEAMLPEAEAHCAKLKKYAVPTENVKQAGIRYQTFECR
jgi:hypothetical protein